MNKKQLKVEAQKAYEIEKENGMITDLNGSAGFKVGWDAAVKLLNDSFSKRDMWTAFTQARCNDHDFKDWFKFNYR